MRLVPVPLAIDSTIFAARVIKNSQACAVLRGRVTDGHEASCRELKKSWHRAQFDGFDGFGA
jgi:hypothetical protein